MTDASSSPRPPQAGSDARRFSDQHVVATLAQSFFEVVPSHLRTYCAVNSRIAQLALIQLGLPAYVEACQVWLAMPGKNYVVGFVANQTHSGKWDGHAICRAGSLFIDAALHHFRQEFGVEVPDVVSGPVFQKQVAAIARIDLAATDRLWWFPPPPGANSDIPEEPDDVTRPLAEKLARHVQGKLAQDSRPDA